MLVRLTMLNQLNIAVANTVTDGLHNFHVESKFYLRAMEFLDSNT